MGLGEKEAKELVSQTLFGASLLMKDSSLSAEELVKKVASKGGTTEAALSVFNENNVKGAIKEGIKKAKKRSEEISGG